MRVDVFDALGRRVSVVNHGPAVGGLRISGLADGTYLVRCADGRTQVVRRLTVAR